MDPVQTHQAPDGLDPHVLAGFSVNYGTTYHALKDIAKLQPGERLCVLGAAGGIGISGIELGKAMGISPFRWEFILSIGNSAFPFLLSVGNFCLNPEANLARISFVTPVLSWTR